MYSKIKLIIKLFDNKIISDTIHDSCDLEIVCTDFDLSEIRSPSLVSTSESSISTILAAFSNISHRCYLSFNATNYILIIDEFVYLKLFMGMYILC